MVPSILQRAIVTDIRLGHGPSGWEIARGAREQAPKIPVIYISACLDRANVACEALSQSRDKD